MSKKKISLLVISLVFGLSLFGYTIYTSGWDNIVFTLKQFSLLKFLFFVLISFVNFYLYSLRWELIVKAIFPEKKIKSLTFFLDRMAGFAVSYVTPVAQMGGEPLRLMLLEEEGVPRKVAASSIVIDKGFEIATLIIFISSGILVSIFEPGLSAESKVVFGIIGAIMLAAVFLFYYTSLKNRGFLTSIYRFLHLKKIKRLEQLESRIEKFEEETNKFYSQHPKVLMKLILISLITIVIIVAEHWLVAHFMGGDLTFVQTFLISTIPYISYLLPIPGGLGVMESTNAALFSLQGITINAFAFIFLIRLRDLIFVMIGLVRGSHKAWSMMKKEFK